MAKRLIKRSRPRKLGGTFERQNFTRGQIDANCEYIDCDFDNCTLTTAANSRFENCTFNSCYTLGEGVLSGAEFNACKFEGVRFGSKPIDSPRSDRSSEMVDLENLVFQDCRFRMTSFVETTARQCNFRGSYFYGCNLRDANFTDCDFSEARLSSSKVGTQTVFNSCEFEHARFTRVQLATMGNSGITKGQQIHMRIVDDAAALHQQYAGFQQWLHLSFLLVFIAPYAFFFLSKIAVSVLPFSKPVEKEAIGLQFVRFIWNGGKDLGMWKMDLAMLSIFLFGLAYNILRLVFLRQSMKLRLEEEIKNTPPNFALDDVAIPKTKVTWRKLSNVSQAGFYIGILLILYHTWHFLTLEVPK